MTDVVKNCARKKKSRWNRLNEQSKAFQGARTCLALFELKTAQMLENITFPVSYFVCHWERPETLVGSGTGSTREDSQ